jgi:hypothetical protein
LIIQTIILYPSGAVWTETASNVSRPDPSGADQTDAENPTRNRKVVDFFGIDGTNAARSTGLRAPVRNSHTYRTWLLLVTGARLTMTDPMTPTEAG